MVKHRITAAKINRINNKSKANRERTEEKQDMQPIKLSIVINKVKSYQMSYVFNMPPPPWGGCRGGIENARNALPLSLRAAEGWQQGG